MTLRKLLLFASMFMAVLLLTLPAVSLAQGRGKAKGRDKDKSEQKEEYNNNGEFDEDGEEFDDQDEDDEETEAEMERRRERIEMQREREKERAERVRERQEERLEREREQQQRESQKEEWEAQPNTGEPPPWSQGRGRDGVRPGEATSGQALSPAELNRLERHARTINQIAQRLDEDGYEREVRVMNAIARDIALLVQRHKPDDETEDDDLPDSPDEKETGYRAIPMPQGMEIPTRIPGSRRDRR